MYTILKRMISRDNYKTKEDLMHKMDILYTIAPSSLSDEEYVELKQLLFPMEETEIVEDKKEEIVKENTEVK